MELSNNVSRADNQQERLVKIGWVVGFVDGEGCFSVGLVKQQDREEKDRIRRGYKTGYQAFCEFAVVQGAKSLSSLEFLQKFFGVGRIYINKRYDNHKEHLYRYCVRRREDLVKVIIPFFESNTLRTAKKNDFEKFVRCACIIENGEHLTNAGMIKIAKVVSTMNRKKPRNEIIRILRYQTPTHRRRMG